MKYTKKQQFLSSLLIWLGDQFDQWKSQIFS